MPCKIGRHKPGHKVVYGVSALRGKRAEVNENIQGERGRHKNHHPSSGDNGVCTEACNYRTSGWMQRPETDTYDRYLCLGLADQQSERSPQILSSECM